MATQSEWECNGPTNQWQIIYVYGFKQNFKSQRFSYMMMLYDCVSLLDTLPVNK